MALAPRWWVFLLLLVSAPALAAGSPEVQLCLQHLKPAEKERASKILGPLEALPLDLGYSLSDRRHKGAILGQLLRDGGSQLGG
jgi:hypothetical protein